MKFNNCCLFIIVFILLNCKSNRLECNTIQKTNIKYVQIQVLSRENHPIKMFGCFDNLIIESFNYTDVNNFISSFYKIGVYTPYLGKSHINYFMNDCDKNPFRNNNKYPSLIMNALINSKTQEKKLNTGELVLINSITMSGVFFKTNKTNKIISKNSMEIDIDEILEIQDVLIPIDNILTPP